jgi:hypothetical protein
VDGVETDLGPEVEFFLRGVNLPCLGPKLRSRLISRDKFSQNLFSIGESTPEIARALSREQAYPLAVAEAMTKVTETESHLFRRQLSSGKSAQFSRIPVLVATTVAFQLWRLTFYGGAPAGHYSTLVPAAVVSTVVLAVNKGLLRYVFHFDREAQCDLEP